MQQQIENTQNDLSSQLTQFGLNPQDWEIQPERNDWRLVISRLDPDFQFLGRTDSNGQFWKNLELISL